jgi:hypothetical protein
MVILHFDPNTGETKTVVDTSKGVHLDHDGVGVDGVDYYTLYTEDNQHYVIMTKEERQVIIDGCEECEELLANPPLHT